MSQNQPSAVVLRHVSFEDLGLLAAGLKRAGWAVSYREAPCDDLDAVDIMAADLLIVLGGPIGVYEADRYPFLARETALLERRLVRRLPTLGICLGAQLMARALGARVYPGHVKEIGWGKVELTQEGRASCLAALTDAEARVLHWHGDTFDLPSGASRLAFNDAYENQAFAFEGHALALQFHLEADPARLEQWFVGHAVELAAAGISVPHLRATTAALATKIRAQAAQIFDPWLDGITTAAI